MADLQYWLDKIDFDMLTDEELDSILDIESAREMALELAKRASGTYILNPAGVRNMGESLMKISEFFKNQPVEIKSIVGSKITPNVGSVSVYGNQIVIDKPREFVKICASTDGFDVYSDLGEVVHLDFIFGDIAKKTQGGEVNGES